MTAGFVGWLACVLVAIAQQKVLGEDSCPRLGQDLAQGVKIMPAKFWPRSWPRSCPRYGKISASWQDLGLLPRSCSSWHESCPRTFCWVLEGKLPPSCRRAGANSGGVSYCSPKMVLVQVATVLAIVMVLWYQSSLI